MHECVADMFDEPTIRFLKGYVALTIHGNNYFWFQKLSAKKSNFGFRISRQRVEDVAEIFDEHNISFGQKRSRFNIICDAEFITKNRDLIRQVSEIVKETWDK